MKKMMILALVLLVSLSFLIAQEEKKEEEAVPQIQEKVMVWPLPIHMREALQVFMNQKVTEYKNFLRANVKGFEEMPENVVFDFATGIFITPAGVAKIQEQQKEVKKDEVKK